MQSFHEAPKGYVSAQEEIMNDKELPPVEVKDQGLKAGFLPKKAWFQRYIIYNMWTYVITCEYVFNMWTQCHGSNILEWSESGLILPGKKKRKNKSRSASRKGKKAKSTDAGAPKEEG